MQVRAVRRFYICACTDDARAHSRATLSQSCAFSPVAHWKIANKHTRVELHALAADPRHPTDTVTRGVRLRKRGTVGGRQRRHVRRGQITRVSGQAQPRHGVLAWGGDQSLRGFALLSIFRLIVALRKGRNVRCGALACPPPGMLTKFSNTHKRSRVAA